VKIIEGTEFIPQRPNFFFWTAEKFYKELATLQILAKDLAVGQNTENKSLS
jgi:hypothetical protein